jgi:hypothetical protein
MKLNSPKLTQDQINFLHYHGISLDLLHDVSGMTKSEYYEKMGKLGKKVGFNANPCTEMGHTLKNRHGHCIQCDTKHISFIKRTKGITYLACSANSKLIKIGFTENIDGREDSLVRTSYGGESDWRVFYHFFSEGAAKIERDTHKALSKYQTFREYSHDGYFHYASELFTFSASLAKSTLEKKIKELGGNPLKSFFKPTVAELFDKPLGRISG